MNKLRTRPEDLPFAVLHKSGISEPAKQPMHLTSQDTCPRCNSGKLEYNGMLNLVCPACGYTLAGCFT